MFVSAAHGQTTLSWEQTMYFQYNIHNVVVASTGTPGSWTVKVMFSVSNPEAGGTLWDIKTAAPFKVTDGASFNLDIGWSSTEFTNTGSNGAALPPIVNTLPTSSSAGGAAMPVQVRSLQSVATQCVSWGDCPGLTPEQLVSSYWVSKAVTTVPATVATGRVALEGRPVCSGLPGCPTAPPFANIPVRSATADFAFVASTSVPPSALIRNPRRQIVDIAKCKGCHDDQQHGDTVVPRLSLHGANRNENLDLCVVCHNPNQTDVPYRFNSTIDPRIGDPETPIDFKVMVHSIHAGGFRKTPYVVIGRNSSVNDYGDVRFPAELRKSCLKCHVVDASGKGSFELPLKSTVLGTTVKTQSIYKVAAGETRTIDVNPANDLKITPTAATCSACHDSSEVRSHMINTGGASFATTQDKIGTTVRERCANCHGPGKDKDVRKVHELSSR
jgi:OmcA/MtrC family decaheme c-type cytochrome